MKNILTILSVSVLLLLLGNCAKVNVFQEPPDQPVIDSLTPASGMIGTQIRLWGSGFSTTTSLNTVKVNGVQVRVDSPSTSTVLLVTITDSTGTGPVRVTVKDRSADGPVFTYLGNGGGGPAPVIIGIVGGVIDESGFGVRVNRLPASDNSIRVRVGGVTVPIYRVDGEGRPNYDPVTGNRILLQDADVLGNAVDIYANFQVSYDGVPSNIYPFQLKPAINDVQSRHGEFVFAVGDTVSITGNFFGTRSLPSRLSVRWNGVVLTEPVIVGWTNKEIRAVIPVYSQIPVGSQIPVSIVVGPLESAAYGVTYTGPVSGTVSLIAGNGNTGSSDGTGSAASFNNPAGLALDASGNLYVADQYNNRIRKISNITAAGGTVTTLAGSTAGFRDGGAADAWFAQPVAVAVDETNAVYVADFVNNRIRKIAGGIVSTFAGDGNFTTFWYPTGIAMHDHNLAYVADMNNNRIQEIINSTVFTIAGGTKGFVNGSGTAAQFNNPYGVALAADETVYIADPGNHAIRKMTPGGAVTTFAGGADGNADGTGTAAQFQLPRALAIDAQGNIYVADFYGPRIRKISPQGVVTTLSPVMADGSGLAFFMAPSGIAVDAQGVLYISDASTHSIYRMTQ